MLETSDLQASVHYIFYPRIRPEFQSVGIVVDSGSLWSYLQDMRPFIQRPITYRYYNATIVLLVMNIVVFLLTILSRRVFIYLALTPQIVVQYRFYWQILTYMFVHGGYIHILFNILYRSSQVNK